MAVEARLDAWLSVLHDLGGSDLLLTDGSKPLLRVDGGLRRLEAVEALTGEEIEAIARTQIDDQYGDRLHLGREVEFSFTWRDIDRVRASAFYQRTTCSLALRRIPLVASELAELGLPDAVAGLLSGRSGLIVVTGQTGSGKSTTLAAMVEEINRTEACHIVTLEDPIEFVHSNRRAVISQREIGTDTRSMATALRAVRREDTDVIVVGEFGDPESIAAVLDLAETGHRVIASLGVNDSASCLARLIDVFPRWRRDQIRVQLAGTLLAVLYQRIVRRRGGGSALAHELLLGLPAVRRLIRDDMLAHLRQTMVEGGMVTLEQSLGGLVETGVIDLQTALDMSLYPQELVSGSLMAGT